MKEVEPGIYKIEGDEVEAFEARDEELKGVIVKLVEEQRARLDAAKPEYAWWADAVFGLRDIKGICTLLSLSGDDETSNQLAEVVGKTAFMLLMRLTNNDEAKVDVIREELKSEGEMLDAIMSKEVAKFMGQQTEQ